MDQSFTEETIKNFTKSMDYVMERKFLKDLYTKSKNVDCNLKVVDLIEEYKKFNNFISELRTQNKVLRTSLDGIDLQKSTTLNVVFLAAFNFLELYKKYYIVEARDYRYYIGIKEIELKRYNLVKNSLADNGRFIRNGENDKPSLFHSISGVLIDYYNYEKNNSKILNLRYVKELRN